MTRPRDKWCPARQAIQACESSSAEQVRSVDPKQIGPLAANICDQDQCSCRSPPLNSAGRWPESPRAAVEPVSWSLSSLAVGVAQVRACRRKATRGVDTQGRRGSDTGSYVYRGEHREVRAWAARSVKRLRLATLGPHQPTTSVSGAYRPMILRARFAVVITGPGTNCARPESQRGVRLAATRSASSTVAALRSRRAVP